MGRARATPQGIRGCGVNAPLRRVEVPDDGIARINLESELRAEERKAKAALEAAEREAESVAGLVNYDERSAEDLAHAQRGVTLARAALSEATARLETFRADVALATQDRIDAEYRRQLEKSQAFPEELKQAIWEHYLSGLVIWRQLDALQRSRSDAHAEAGRIEPQATASIQADTRFRHATDVHREACRFLLNRCRETNTKVVDRMLPYPMPPEDRGQGAIDFGAEVAEYERLKAL